MATVEARTAQDAGDQPGGPVYDGFISCSLAADDLSSRAADDSSARVAGGVALVRQAVVETPSAQDLPR